MLALAFYASFAMHLGMLALALFMQLVTMQLVVGTLVVAAVT